MIIPLHEMLASLPSYCYHRTNPKANVKLSGKKKRLLLKEAKRLISEKKEMEGELGHSFILE